MIAEYTQTLTQRGYENPELLAYIIVHGIGPHRAKVMLNFDSYEKVKYYLATARKICEGLL